MADTVKIKINGKEYEAQKDESILQVARRNGIYIPAICYSDRFGAIGACRICAVEIAGMKKPMLSCAMKVKDGMEILTDSEKVQEFRRKIVYEWDKFHPLQCGVCDKSGECELQDINYELNITENPLEKDADPLSIPERTIHYEWRIIHHDANLCIQCRRCVTICDRVVNFGTLALVKKEWGGREIDTKDGKPLDCEFCGQCVSICPTGAMSSKLFKYKARPWELEKVRTTCQFCSSGCQMDLNVKDNIVLRVTSEDNTPNRANLCNLGRFNYSVTYKENLIQNPTVEQREVSLERAIKYAADTLKSHKPDEIAAICGARETIEDQLALKLLFENAIKSKNIDSFASTHIGKLYRVLPKGVSPLNNVSDMEQCDAIFVFGGDIANEMPRLDWQVTRNVKLLKKSKLITAYWRDTKFDTLGSTPLRYEPGQEVDFLNSLFSATAQKMGVKSSIKGSMEFPEDAIKVLTEANKVAFIIGQESLERPDGESIATAFANLILLLNKKAKLYASSKYNNAYGALFSGVTSGFDLYAKKREKGFDLYELPELVDKGKIKALLLLSADLFTVFSDEDARTIFDKAEVIYIDSYMTESVKFSKVVIPSAPFATMDGHFVNIEGKFNRVQKAVEYDAPNSKDILLEISNQYGYSIPTGYIKDALAKATFEFDISTDKFRSVKSQGFNFGSSMKGVIVYSKFRSGIFSSLGDGASIAMAEPVLEINPEDGQSIGVKDGSYVNIEGSSALKVKVKFDEKMPKGIVSIPLWFMGHNAYNLSGSLNNLFSAKLMKGE